MARFCPITGTKVVYLECQECEDKVCKKPSAISASLPEFTLEPTLPELIALKITQNCFGWLHGELTGAHILHEQEGEWYPEYSNEPTKQQKAVLDEAATIVNALREKYDLKDLGLKMAREKYVKADHGMYLFAFYNDCFYVVIFDRKVVEEWYNTHINTILQETQLLVDKGIISYPEEEWEEAGTQGCYHVSIHVGEYVYFGNIRTDGPDTLNAQVAKQLICRCMDAYMADFLKEHGVYE